ncbi:MAG TPA: FAD-dependent oxidoreductase [Propionibacteriaceae bacterium]|jgi:NADPH-dependent 2,4-dienoyl-CoA reductase/sulfur reductase-like enzyme|nr:FAD-dependent oxidoreductase [Propionibacteriaceae bacterium]
MTIVDNTVSVDVLIVGGGPGGLAVARGYREAGGRGTVLLVSADEHPPYARPPLTKDYLRGESEADDMPLADEDWYRDNAVELRLGTLVTRIDAAQHQAELSDGSTVRYGRLALATGHHLARCLFLARTCPGSCTYGIGTAVRRCAVSRRPAAGWWSSAPASLAARRPPACPGGASRLCW